MKFTILPDFEANRKRRAIRRQKRGAVCPCASDSWNGWCMVF